MMNVWGMTDVGLARRENQDAYAVYTDPDNGFTIGVVCDGMGGPGGGQLASQLAVETFLAVCRDRLRRDMSARNVQTVAESAVKEANAVIYQRACADRLWGMGTTLVSAIAWARQALVSNVGDSRAYRIPAGGGIVRITKDHSFVEGLVDRGDITAEEARIHPHRNLITRALGPDADTQLLSDSYQVSLEPGDYLLLCTDGLVGTATDLEMEREVLRGDNDTCLARLLKIAKAQGAPDNVTAVLLRQQ